MSEHDAPEPLEGDDRSLPARDGGGRRVRYEIVFDCRDRSVGARLVSQLEGVADGAVQAVRTEEGPTWALSVEFPDRVAADEFFRGDGYRQFCIEARRASRSSVLVVPLGETEDA